MTKINLITQGQQLISANKVVIAAGDVNSVELHVEFDSAWADYPARSATFYTSKDATVQEMMISNDSCIVPFEVLAESCVLFIGVRGISADGERLKTSTLAKYKISEGATAGDKTLTPTMDLYQQYLAALKAEADPIIAAVRESAQAEASAAIEKVKTEAEASITKMASELKRTVLWENPDPTVRFAGQTIAMDLTEYEHFKILLKDSISADRYFEASASFKGYELIFGNVNHTDYYRRCTFSNDGVWFSNTVGSSSNNDYTIPVKIIGYKY